MTKKTFHLIYSILLSVVLVAAGICLMVACLGIYRSGDRPFTPDAVAAAFSTIAVPVYICLALVAGGFVLDGFWGMEKKKTVPQKQYGVILEKLHAKADVRTAPVVAEQKKRRLHKVIALVLLAVGSIVFLSYGADPSNFTLEDVSGSMAKAMYRLLPCMAVPFGYSVFSAYYSRKSMQREIALVKQAMAEGAPAPAAAVPEKVCRLGFVRWALLAVAVVILVYGFFAGGTKDVLTKAVNICTECVGLG